MIQRIQTVYLAIGVACIGAAPFAGSLWSGVASDQPWHVPVVTFALGLSFIAAFAAILLYRKRDLQRTVVVVAQLMTLAALVALFVGRRTTEALPGAQGATTADWLLFVLPVSAYVLFLLARRAIDKDIRLLKSVDRLR